MADPSIGGGRDVWASTAMLEATRAERARHAASCRDAAGAIAAAAARRGLAPMAPLGRVAALRAALTRLGLDDGELASEETLAAALGDWALQHADRNVADDGPHIGAGDADDQDLLAAAAIFDVRVVVVCVSINQCVGCTDNSSLSHFSAMTRPSWLGRAAKNQHRVDGVEYDAMIQHERAVKF